MGTYRDDGERNDGMGYVTIAEDLLPRSLCFFCERDIQDGDRIYIDIDSDRIMCYSHVGQRVDYGLWMGRMIDIKNAVILDDGEYLGYMHPYMEDQGVSVMYAGQAHYQHLSASGRGE